jgi:2Fe-2S iron-sulfur cluster binding domain
MFKSRLASSDPAGVVTRPLELDDDDVFRTSTGPGRGPAGLLLYLTFQVNKASNGLELADSIWSADMRETEFRLTVNDAERSVACEPDTPLLDVLRLELGLAGPKFGCGMGLCGACFVLIAGSRKADHTVRHPQREG